MSRKVAFGISSLLAGALLVLASFKILTLHEWMPLNLPVTLEQGEIRTPEFTTDLDGQYMVELFVEDQPETDRMDCLLGTAYVLPERCKDTPEVLDLSWTLASGQSVVAQGGTSKDNWGFWGSGSGRGIGRFTAQKGGQYTLTVNVHKDATVLAPWKPCIRVRAHNAVYEDYHILSQLALFAGTLGILGGLALFVQIIIVRFRSYGSGKHLRAG